VPRIGPAGAQRIIYRHDQNAFFGRAPNLLHLTRMRAQLNGGSRTENAYQRLRSDLLACRLRPGDWLNIKELCSKMEVSLGAVREALSRLTSEGLVIAEPQRGFRVSPISAKDLLDLTTARIEIEGICLRRAIAVGDVDWETNLVAAGHRLNRTDYHAAEDPKLLSDAWNEAHRAFHESLVAGCDNHTLLQVRRQLYAQSERYRRLSVPLAPDDRDLSWEHREIMEAALARDADRATELMGKHLSLTAQIVLQALQPRPIPKAELTRKAVVAHRRSPAKRSDKPPARR
jgi:DNA-binding GntR family transcriptional regulator